MYNIWTNLHRKHFYTFSAPFKPSDGFSSSDIGVGMGSFGQPSSTTNRSFGVFLKLSTSYSGKPNFLVMIFGSQQNAIIFSSFGTISPNPISLQILVQNILSSFSSSLSFLVGSCSTLVFFSEGSTLPFASFSGGLSTWASFSVGLSSDLVSFVEDSSLSDS